jgi:predicted SnoaL-like aldol condensation-catalyzing enzyme
MFVAGCSDSSDSNAPPMPSQNEALESQNKELVRRIYTEVIGQNKTDLVSELFAADYIQHDSTVPSGPAGQITLVENLKTKIPGLVATIKHIGADGDYVAVHWQASATPDDEATGQAAVDLYRVSDGKIAEHWDAFQDVPATTASGNSMFSDLYEYKQPKQDVTEAQEEANETMAVNAYTGLFGGNIALLDQYWDPVYLQHNPQVPNGVEGLRGLIGSLPPGGIKLEFIETLADDDLVYTFGLDSTTNHVLTDIFRVVDNKIVEHWDVLP